MPKDTKHIDELVQTQLVSITMVPKSWDPPWKYEFR
jgi:hypothetical protein